MYKTIDNINVDDNSISLSSVVISDELIKTYYRNVSLPNYRLLMPYVEVIENGFPSEQVEIKRAFVFPERKEVCVILENAEIDKQRIFFEKAAQIWDTFWKDVKVVVIEEDDLDFEQLPKERIELKVGK